MERTPINPWTWQIELGFEQAELIEGHRRLLVCSGQDAVDADGKTQHPGDMAAQLELALDNLEALLTVAEMTFANVVRLNAYTTDVDECLALGTYSTALRRRQPFCDLCARDHASSGSRPPRLAGGHGC